MAGKGIYLVHYVCIQGYHGKVVDHHGPLESEGLAVGHEAGPRVHREEDVGQQDEGHQDGAVHQEVAPQPVVCKSQERMGTVLHGPWDK